MDKLIECIKFLQDNKTAYTLSWQKDGFYTLTYFHNNKPFIVNGLKDIMGETEYSIRNYPITGDISWYE